MPYREYFLILICLLYRNLLLIKGESKIQNEQNYEICTPKNLIIKPSEEYFFKKELNSGTIKSPKYPQNYSKNSECIVNIKAPKNYIVKLSFQSFNLEPSSECVYDYLEIRDGPYGYSPIVGRFCGTQLPPYILSSGREVWLRFNSDDSIQKNGFFINFEFKKARSSYFYTDQNSYFIPKYRHIECEIFVNNKDLGEAGDAIITNDYIEQFFNKKLNEIKRKTIEDSDKNHLFINENLIECTIVFEFDIRQKLFLNFEKINISEPHNVRTSEDLKKARLNCTENYIQVFDGSTAIVDKKLHICFSQTNMLYKSKSNKIYIRYAFNKRMSTDFVNFKLVYNTYVTGPCGDSFFDCLDNTCINKSLTCNSRKNCNHSVDELNCVEVADLEDDRKSWTSEQKAAILNKIILSTVGSILSVAIVLSVSISCKRSLDDNRKKRQEYESLKLMDKKIPILLKSLQIKDDVSNSDSRMDQKDYVFVTSSNLDEQEDEKNSSKVGDRNLVLLKPMSIKETNNNSLYFKDVRISYNE